MECPICFEQMRAAYQLKGCCHKVCGTCKGRLQEQPESVYYAFQGVFLIEEAPQIQLKCPLCRALEPVKTAEELKAAYPEAYLHEISRQGVHGTRRIVGFDGARQNLQRLQKYH